MAGSSSTIRARRARVGHDVASAGSSSVKVLPRPGSLSTVNLAAVRRHDLLRDGRPTPGAPDVRRRPRRGRAYELLEDRCCSARGMPAPRSTTADRRTAVSRAPLEPARCALAGEYLIALSMRLLSASDRALPSARTGRTASGPSSSIALPDSRARSVTSATTSRTRATASRSTNW